jgi:biopolymer transport protein ExbB/TolQ
MKTKIQPIISWSICAGGLSLVMGIVTRNHLIAGFQADNTGMSYVISALFAAGLVVSFLAAKQLQSEWGVLSKIKETDKIPSSRADSDLASVFKRLESSKDKGEMIDAHTAIDTYHSKHNSRVRSVSIMAALVISMGLLGTVVGLIMSISGLGGMVENIGLSRTMMMDALKMTVAGMGTAFYTTFFGALFGLILRAVAVSQLNSLSELCAEAAEYADTNLVAKLEDKEELIIEQVSKLVSSFEYMQQEIDALTVRIAQSIDNNLKTFGEAIEDAGSYAMETTKESIKGMTEEMTAYGEEVGNAFSTFNNSIEHAGEELHEAIGAVNTHIEASGAELHEAFNGLNDSVRQAGDTVGGSLADFKMEVDGTSSQLHDAVDELHSAISQATGEMVSMAKAKLDTDAHEIAGHLSIAADSIQHYLAQKTAGDSNQKVA